MNVKETKFTIKYLPPRQSVLLKSRHGLGKSEIVRQCCVELSKEKGVPYEYVDIRLSQREVGDIIGLPRAMDSYDIRKSVYVGGELQERVEVATNVMVHDLPIWFPRDKDSCGILHLDEIDRAPRESQQAAFEIVLDYSLNLNPLPIGWRVVSCINGDQDLYSVLGMDHALKDRFCEIEFKPTVPEWQDHAKKIGVHDAVQKYIAKIPSDLDTPESIKPDETYQSRRSWVKFSDALLHLEKESPIDPLDKQNGDYLLKLAKGFLGVTVAQNFLTFVEEDYKVYSVEDILNDFNPEMESDFSRMLPTQVDFYGKLIVDYLLENKHTMTQRQDSNLSKFYRAISAEAASGFWSLFSNKYRKEASRWYKKNEAVKERTRRLIGRKTALGE